jgi:spermidine/putrescine transport system ATP-binding protein
MSDRLAVLRDGRLMQVGTPSQVYSRPADSYVAGFLGTANLFDAVVTHADGQGTWCRVGTLHLLVDAGDLATVPGTEVSVVVRPERVQLAAGDDEGPAAGDNVFRGSVRQLVFRGAQTQVSVAVGDLTILADVANVHGEVPGWLAEGREVAVRISAAAAQLLPRADTVSAAATRSPAPQRQTASRSGTPAGR